MFNNEKLATSFLSVFFLITTGCSFLIGQIYYLTTKGPDYSFYNPYFKYFFGDISSTGVEQGLLYYFVNSAIIAFNSENLISTYTDQYFSNSIQLGNFLFYLIGLLGIFTFLKEKGFKSNSVLIILSLINLFPPATGMRLLFKPEILIFSCLIWVIIFFDKYLDTSDWWFLGFSIPPLAIIFTTKANLAVMIAAYLSIFYLIKIYDLNASYFYKSLGVLLLLFFIISYENYQANGLLVYEHQSPEEFTGSAEISFLYNVNFNQLVQNPFRQSHSDSYLGIMLLDTFDDYFGNFWNDDSSPLYLNRVIFFSIKETAFLGGALTLIFYLTLFRKIFTMKKFRYILFMPFFGILFQMILSQFTQYNPATGDVAKTYYYSFFLVITFALIVADFARRNPKLFIITGILFSLSTAHIYGFPKTSNDGELSFLEINNEVNSFCRVGNIMLRNIDSSCIPKKIQVCNNAFLTNKKVTIRNSEYVVENTTPTNSVYFTENNQLILSESLKDCFNKLDENYSLLKQHNIKKYPVWNLLTGFLFLLSLVFFLTGKTFSNRTKYIY